MNIFFGKCVGNGVNAREKNVWKWRMAWEWRMGRRDARPCVSTLGIRKKNPRNVSKHYADFYIKSVCVLYFTS